MDENVIGPCPVCDNGLLVVHDVFAGIVCAGCTHCDYTIELQTEDNSEDESE